MTKNTKPLDNSVPERPNPVGESYQLWRPKNSVDHIATYLSKYKEPGYIYRGVHMNNEYNPLAVEDAEKVGYEIVYSTHQFSDDRAFAPDAGKRDSSVPGPVIKHAKFGVQYLLMRIPEAKFNQLKDRQAKADRDRHSRTVVSVKSKGDHIMTDGGFIDIKNNNGDS